MKRPLLNMDAGEHEDENEALLALADAVNIACGGHAGDERSMARLVRLSRDHGARVGAHPSYPDCAGFGRTSIAMPIAALRESVASQCAFLRRVAESLGVRVAHVKPHGALYHDATTNRLVATAVLDGVRASLGDVVIVGAPHGALHDEAYARGLTYEREGFADRARRADGSLVPRNEPGALVVDPHRAAAQARLLAAEGIDTICVHADTPGALAIARAVRAALDAS